MTWIKILASAVIIVAFLGVVIAITRALGHDDVRHSEEERND